MRKLKAITALAILATLIVAIPALADGLVTVTAGALAVTSEDVDFGAYAADFGDQTGDYETSAGVWGVSDLTGAEAGWTVTIAGTDFINGSESFPTTVAADTVRVNNSSAGIACTTGVCTAACLPASTAFGAAGDNLSTTPLKVFHNQPVSVASQCSEDGVWDWQPYFRLTVPGGTIAGNYVSTWTVTISTYVP